MDRLIFTVERTETWLTESDTGIDMRDIPGQRMRGLDATFLTLTTDSEFSGNKLVADLVVCDFDKLELTGKDGWRIEILVLPPYQKVLNE